MMVNEKKNINDLSLLKKYFHKPKQPTDLAHKHKMTTKNAQNQNNKINKDLISYLSNYLSMSPGIRQMFLQSSKSNYPLSYPCPCLLVFDI